ncbi:MAG: cytochrome c [Bacteroidota bacterium]
MKSILTFFCLAALLFACGDSSEKDSAAAKPAAQDGEKVYKSYCVTCHGIYGDMGASGAFNLTTSTLSVPQRVEVITNGRAGTAMIGFQQQLTEEKIQAVAEYTLKLKK